MFSYIYIYIEEFEKSINLLKCILKIKIINESFPSNASIWNQRVTCYLHASPPKQNKRKRRSNSKNTLSKKIGILLATIPLTCRLNICNSLLYLTNIHLLMKKIASN